MQIGIFHEDNEVYIKMSVEKFESLLIEYLKTYTPKEALKKITEDLKRSALTK